MQASAWGGGSKPNAQRVGFQVGGMAVEIQVCARETQGFKTCSAELRDWLERKQGGFVFGSLWCFPSHHRDNERWEVK